MRPTRLLSTGLAITAGLSLAATEAAAQLTPRVFENSWFWGVKGGGMLYNTRRVRNAVAPLIGAEWLITRRRAGLNVSASQTFFDDQSSVDDPSLGGNPRTVRIQNMRQVSASVFAFPDPVAGVRPYGGLGFAFNLISSATPAGTFSSTAARDAIRDTLHAARTGTFIIGTVGGQMQFWKTQIFGQASLAPKRRTFLLNTDNTYFFELGVRHNFGSSIERPQ